MELYALKELSSSDSDLHEVDVYYLEKIIQKGKNCTRLMKAQSADEEESISIKLFPKSNNDQCSNWFTKEEQLMSKLSHPNLIKCHAFYKDALIKGKNDEFTKYSAIMLDYVSSTDLLSLVSEGSLSEKLARTLFKQMISVVEYLHGQQLAHLDLNPENFLVKKDGVKLVNLVSCQNTQNNGNSDVSRGSRGYRPPEIIEGNFKDLKAADIYALGIILFVMVAGTPPYAELENGKFDQYYEALRKDTEKFWKVHDHYRAADDQVPFSKEFKELIQGMLSENPRDRLKMEDIKKSQWVAGDMCSNEELMRGLSCHY